MTLREIAELLHAAVLAGDYLLGKAIQLLANADDLPILAEMLHTTAAMSEGELMQLEKRLSGGGDGPTDDPTDNGLDQLLEEGLSKEDYLEVITRKTALLFRSCCVGGALSMGASGEAVTLLADFGLHLGRVFQLRDDVLDDDVPTTMETARQLIEAELAQTLEALRAVGDKVGTKETLKALESLALFCAERSH